MVFRDSFVQNMNENDVRNRWSRKVYTVGMDVLQMSNVNTSGMWT
jgi:hypothetical protein